VPDQPRVIALVATRFRADLLRRLLNSLASQTIRPLAAVVCDNGPDAATVEAAKQSSIPCKLLSPGKNLGFGGGLASAGRHALEKFPDLSYLLIVDDDAVLAPQDLEKLLASAREHSAGCVAPFLIDATGKLQEVPEPVSWPLARAFRSAGQDLQKARSLAPSGYPMAWCIGPCLLVDQGTWLRAGPPRSDMLAFGDDVEFSLRLSAASPAWADPSVTVIHAPPVAKQPPSPSVPGLRPLFTDDTAHYRKFGMLLQNLAFTCVVSPRPRHLPLYLPGNVRRFLRTFKSNPANLLEVSRRLLLGFFGQPAGSAL
jgi:GT2 family glycosyltransferase